MFVHVYHLFVITTVFFVESWAFTNYNAGLSKSTQLLVCSPEDPLHIVLKHLLKEWF